MFVKMVAATLALALGERRCSSVVFDSGSQLATLPQTRAGKGRFRVVMGSLESIP